MQFKGLKVHFIYAFSIVISTLLILVYFAWHQHQLEVVKLAGKQKEIIVQKEKKYEQDNCINNVVVFYNRQWSLNCAIEAQKVKTALNNCIKEEKAYSNYMAGTISESDAENLFKLGKATCYSSYPDVKVSSNCRLPIYIANALNSQLKNNENECKKV